MIRLLHWPVLVAIALASCAREPAVVAPSPSARLRVIPLTTSSAEARAAFERGERLMYEGRLAQSKPHFEAAIAADPALAYAYIGLAGAAANADRRRLVARARELATALPEIERLWVEAAWSGISGDPSAIATAERVAALAPDDWRAHAHVGSIAEYHLEDYAKAWAAYERAVALAPDRATPYRGLARARAALGDLAGAATAVDRYAALCPGEPRPLQMKGEILLLAGRLDEAEQAFRAAIAADPAYRAEDGIAMVRLYRGDVAGAVAALRAALAKRSVALEGTSEDHLARLFLGRALVWTLVAAGQFDQAEAAISAVEAAIAATGAAHASLRGQELRIELLAERGRWPEALRAIEAAVTTMRADGVSRPRLERALELLHLRVSIGADDRAAIERAHAALRAGGADDPAAKRGDLLVAHHRRDTAGVLAAADAMRGDDEAQAEARLLAAELRLAAGDRDGATRLWRQVAGTFGLSPEMLIARRRAERALAAMQ